VAKKAAKVRKVLVSRRALIQRINRRLDARQEKLCVTRGQRMRMDVGDYYVVDYNRNFVVASHVDLEEWGRELDALKGYEVVAEE